MSIEVAMPINEQHRLSASYTVSTAADGENAPCYTALSVARAIPRLEERNSISEAFADALILVDAEDISMLQDESVMAHVRTAEQAHARANAGEDVDWPAVIKDHIVQ